MKQMNGSTPWSRSSCLLRITEELKAEYAVHQLQAPAGILWSHHRTTYLEGTPIT